MVFGGLVTAREWAILLLAVEMFVLALVPLFILYHVTRWLRQLIPKVTPALRNVHRKLRNVSYVIGRVLEFIRAPFVWVMGISEGIRVVVVSLLGALSNGGEL